MAVSPASREWLTLAQLAEEIGVPVSSIYNWRTKGGGPRAARFGRHLRINRADADAWIASRYDDATSA